MSEQTPLKGGNPGFAGELGDYSQLTEADVRGSEFVKLPKEGGIGGGVCAYPYQIAERNPDAKLFEGPYRTRLQKIIARYPEKQLKALGI